MIVSGAFFRCKLVNHPTVFQYLGGPTRYLHVDISSAYCDKNCHLNGSNDLLHRSCFTGPLTLAILVNGSGAAKVRNHAGRAVLSQVRSTLKISKAQIV